MTVLATPIPPTSTPASEVERGEIYSLIDDFIKEMSNRNLVDTNSVMDFCLDMRNILQRNEV